MLKTLTQKIVIILITIIMVSNFIMPNYVHAGQSAGEKLVSSFFYLLAYVGDKGIGTMQNLMTEYGSEIKLKKDKQTSYAIKYSPGMIFANEILALDINFINPNKNVTTTDGEEELVESFFPTEIPIAYYGTYELEEGLKEYGFIREKAEWDVTSINGENGEYGASTKYIWTDENTGKIYEYIHTSTGTRGGYTRQESSLKMLYDPTTLNNTLKKYHYDEATTIMDDGNITKINYKEYNKYEWILSSGERYKVLFSNYPNFEVSVYKVIGEARSSTAAQLQKNVATWYRALRTIALVGLLSVLVYIGIRIILSSSSAQDKAKYKNMLKDWLVAICILFILHYIMAFMLNITVSLGDIIKGNVVTNNGTTISTRDELMSTIREKLGDSYEDASVGDTAGYTVMYLALVILTGVFTIQYLKRVIFMAFLTMIAPMIALTYPLDKIKDGKAQAFSFWLREYIFNCLIQPVHLLLYAVLITNAIDFATKNVLYAIVALAFLVPAEKFIKEMFGMKSQSPTSQLGAAAGGAMVMSMLNKIKAKPPKDGGDSSGSGSSSGGSNGVRTATRNGGGASGSGSTGGSGSEGSSDGGLGSNPGGPGAAGAGTSTGNSGSTGGGAGSNSSSGGLGSRINAAAKKNIYGVDALKSHGKKFSRALGGAALGTLAGTAALAAQVATGDLLEDPLKAGAAVAGTTAIGYHAGSNLVGSSFSNIKNLAEGAKKIAYGEEEYSNRQFDKKFFSSEGYKTITEDSSIDQTNIKARTQEFLDNGITNVDDIRKALQSGVSGDEYKAMTSIGMDKKDISAFAKVKEKNADKNLSASEIAARMQIAKNLPPQLYNDQDGFVRFAKRYGIDKSKAEELFEDIDKFI